MDHSDGRARGVGRRASIRRSLATSIGSSRDDEDYDLSAIAVADGFRPADSSSSQTRSTSASQPNSDTYDTNTNTDTDPDADFFRSISQPPSLADTSSKQTGNRPSSITKPHRPHDSLTLRNDGSNPAAVARPAAATTRALNSSPLMRVESPYRGPSGPSHPYQMYPQRANSNASASTAGAAAERSYNGPRGPAHPYALYTQNTVPVEETQEEHIPVGFNGQGNTYQRQLGPDGEEAGDLIGPLGHMEELPPYTRYPTAAFVRKDSTDDSATPNTDSSSSNAIAGAGGIGMATRNPEFSSTDEDLQLSRSRPSVRSATSDVSRHDINTAAREITEKPTMGKWQKRAKKKMWGIVPYWAICLLVAGLVLMGVIMGSVIGTLLSKHDKDDKGSDIKPITALPVDLDPLVTGFFSLPPLVPSQSPKSCFKDTTQSQAWSCEMPFRYYQMDIEPIDHAPETKNYELILTAISPADAKFIYGTQPPIVPDPMALTLVTDTFEQGRGPAWWLNVTYDKTVIIDEYKFSSLSKRGWTFDDPDLAGFDPSHFKKKSMGAEPGDKPWICTWPETTLEIFIYPSQNISLQSYTTSSSSVPPATATAAYEEPAPTETSDLDDQPALVPYPNVVKFLERRLSSNSELTEASCRQVEVSDDGLSAEDIKDSDGDPIVVIIAEDPNSVSRRSEQSHRSQHSRSWSSDVLVPRGGLELTSCGCLWMST